jgi:exodeoxyribonuclease V beta subunit
MRPDFVIADTALAPGVTLIEASAGTGKTYTIAGLYLRLVVEEGLTVGEILVTTYTVPATAELRERIRTRLREALDAWTHGTSKHQLIQDLLAHGRIAADLACKRLAAALRAFDEAAIHTIHGFCERVLRERAFESRLLFDAELLTDQSALLREVAEDYWRTHIAIAAPATVATAMQHGLSPAAFVRLLQNTTAHPQLRILPGNADRSRLAAALDALSTRFRQQWPAWRENVRAHFLPTGAWAKGECRKPDVMDPRLALVDLCAADPAAPVIAYEALAFFTAEKIQEDTRAGQVTPAHPFFDLCSEIAARRREFAVAVEAEFLAWARAELPARRLQRNVHSFDDLLTRLHAALHRPGGERLAALIRSRYRAALIDEFQDTDPIQEEIFRTIFGGGEPWLYLIGDPKQAIYGFRGADVFSYLRAAQGAARQFRLGTNQRSSRALIAAVNAIFTKSMRPFVVPEIGFEPVAAAGRADAKPLLFAGKARAPFHFWLPESDEPLVATRTARELPARAAAAIARLLASEATLEGRPLAPPDFAVLTMKNREARAIRAALGAAGIPSVLLSDASVFQSPEAAEMQTLLAALAEPARHGLLRAALATSLLALTAAEIDALSAGEQAWEAWLLRGQRWHELWRSAGFMRMFRAVLREGGVRPRLLAQSDGERALTNFLHLAELLHQAAAESRLAPTALAQWLAERRRDRAKPSEDHELRLERDEDAVRIVTVHKSKGLEYNIVLCPFAWGQAQLQKTERPCFHDATGLTLDLDAAGDSIAAARAEKLQEQTRLLYVAMTRARHECHFVWGRFKGNEVSAANWLLHPPTGDPPLTALSAHAATLTPQIVREEIAALASAHPDAIAIEPFPDPDAPPDRTTSQSTTPLRARAFRGAIDRRWRISSFTSLTEHRDSEQPDYDRAPGETADLGVAPTGIHAFPAGKTPGVCLHAIFEHLDFTAPETIDRVVAHQLNAHGFDDAEWRDPVADCVRRTLRAPLTPHLKLAQVPLTSRLAELEFHFPVAQLDPATLSALIGEAGGGRLSFDARRGLLKGFIDLVFEHEGRFFIVDWKSNRLGSDASAYGPPALHAAMARQHYGLQYHLYTVALHRYLRLRLGADYDYARHFGGVFYLFLRGIDPADADRGIFRDRPSRERIAALEAQFADCSGGR